MSPINANDPYDRQTIEVLGTEMSYVDTGTGDPIVFLHGNPTSAYLWRNVIPHLEPHGRCLAPDLVGMGRSGPSSSGTYRFVDHYAHFEAWMNAVGADERVVLVVHDWGSGLGFHWAHQHPKAVRGIAYMEAIVGTVSWDDWPEAARGVFQGLRSPAGDEMVLDNNVFVERILPGSIIRDLTDEEMDEYRRPFVEPGEGRRPTLTWPREIPIDGEPADVHAIVEAYAGWLETASLPKLFVNADPGAILIGLQREACRAWPNQTEVTVPGIHFIQEDSPDEIGAAVAAFVTELG
jgi:haloalkane dehalogenase